MGAKCGAKAYKIMYEGHRPEYMPLTFFREPYRLRVNREAMKAQGVTLQDETLDWLFKNGEIV